MKITRLGAGALAFSALSLALAASPGEAQAQVMGNRTFGLGLALGYPDVGISANIINGPTSIQLVGSVHYNDFANAGALYLRGDYLFYPAVLARGGALDLKFYIGPGLNLGLGLGNVGGFYLGAELPIGLAFQFRRAPIDIALEAVPVLGIVSSNSVDLGFGVGGTFHIRYYF